MQMFKQKRHMLQSRHGNLVVEPVLFASVELQKPAAFGNQTDPQSALVGSNSQTTSQPSQPSELVNH